jgi:hypothetical protein
MHRLRPKGAMRGKQNLIALAALFDRDHQSHRRLLEQVAYFSASGSEASAAQVFRAFQRVLDHHMAAEEHTLEALVADGHCPRSVAESVLGAHGQLKELISDVSDTLIRSEGTRLGHALAGLSRALTAHERMEEEELLPLLCATFSNPKDLARVTTEILDGPR